MECNHVSDRLYEYIYDELDEKSADAIKKHIDICSKCHAGYMELKKLLIDDMSALENLKDSIEMPDDLPLKVKSSLKPGFGFNFVKFAATACILVSLIFTTPVLAYYIIQSTPLQKYVELDSNVIVDFEEGKGQLIQKSNTMNGITLTIDGIIPGKDKATLLFTIKVPKDGRINYGMPSGIPNIMTVTDQFGTKYHMRSGALSVKSVNEYGEVKCIYDMDPLKFWTYRLNIRATAIELGHFEEGKPMEKIRNAYGTWDVSFYINRF